MENEKKLTDLIDDAVALGFPREVAETFKVKAQVQAVIDSIVAKNKEVEESKSATATFTPEAKKVETLEEKPDPTEEKRIEKAWKSKARIMMDKWLAAPTSQILCPGEPGVGAGEVEWRRDKNGYPYQVALTPANTIECVIVNGACWLVPRGTFVEVPQPVAKIIADRLQLTNMAGSNISLDRVDPKTNKKMNEVI